MNKVKLINILSFIIYGAFALYIILRDGLTPISIMLVVLSPLFCGFIATLLMGLIAPEMIESEPDRYGDSDGEF